ncbi:hypothetical protein EBR96_03665 [bacterium]|nr:hypothetical protein [bacterium]
MEHIGSIKEALRLLLIPYMESNDKVVQFQIDVYWYRDDENPHESGGNLYSSLLLPHYPVMRIWQFLDYMTAGILPKTFIHFQFEVTYLSKDGKQRRMPWVAETAAAPRSQWMQEIASFMNDGQAPRSITDISTSQESA